MQTIFNVLLLWLFFEVRVLELVASSTIHELIELVGSYPFFLLDEQRTDFYRSIETRPVDPDEQNSSPYITATTKAVSRIRVTPWKLAKIRRYEPTIHTQCRLLPPFFRTHDPFL